MIGQLLPLFVAVPLLSAGLLAMYGRRPLVHATLMIGVICASIAASVFLVIDLADGGAHAHGVGQWPLGIAIPFAADMFSALMLTVTGLLTLMCVWFALATQRDESRFFAPLILVLLAGVNGALLTADLFNLFVFLEVMLLPSYGLMVLNAKEAAPLRQIAGARLYVTLNMLTSTLFLIGVAFVYGTIGTVNLAELAGAARENETVALAMAVCLFALGIKAAIVPVHGWLARAYPSTSPAVTALFSGLHTKIAIYGIYRLYAVVFGGDARWLWIGMVLFCITMVVGVLGAVGEKTTRTILAFHMVSQIGYILVGVALFSLGGLTAGIFYLLHHMIVKASLFLSTGAVEVQYGSGTLGRVSGMAKREPVIAAAFFIAALSLAGLPPFSGFVAKLSLIFASVERGEVAAVVTMLVVSIITLLSMLKIWSAVFWGKPQAPVYALPPKTSEGTTGIVVRSEPSRIRPMLAAPAVLTATITVGLGLGAQLLLWLASVAASGLLDPTAYLQAVMGA